ncbi:GIY-YIG nuclease family protein [Oceanobacillus picturae]|uniref:GIY-YIG nuclease family protein n=1 Tax=Oceanobacillus picturae TaxID=171693 RepID=UPI00073D7C69|nr:GIY-YIG nuclease family protein [Oceanobacillus picturae]
MSWYPKYWRDDHITERFIYALVDPRLNKNLIYIGHTSDYKRRYYEHTRDSDPSMSIKYIEWLDELSSFSMKPKMVVLEYDELALYEVIQFESAWIRVALKHGYELVNSIRDQERGIDTFEGIEQLSNVRSIPIDYLEDIKKSMNKFFFLPNEFIGGVQGVYASGVDFSILRRIEIEEALEALIEEYLEKGDIRMANILISDYDETREFYSARRQSKLDKELNKIKQKKKLIIESKERLKDK